MRTCRIDVKLLRKPSFAQNRVLVEKKKSQENKAQAPKPNLGTKLKIIAHSFGHKPGT